MNKTPHGYIALDGTKAARTPRDCAYCYDRFALYRNGWKPDDTCLPSKDVLRHEHYGTYAMRLFHNKGQWFTSRDPGLVQVLVSMTLERPVILTGIEEECHTKNGYPEWFFWYREPSPENAIRLKAAFYDILLERDKTYEKDLKKDREMWKSLFGDGFNI